MMSDQVLIQAHLTMSDGEMSDLAITSTYLKYSGGILRGYPYEKCRSLSFFIAVGKRSLSSHRSSLFLMWERARD